MRILVSGGTATLARVATEHGDVLGRLTSPKTGSSVESLVASGLPWACDNDCFAGFDAGAYRRMLAKVAGAPGLLWVTCPDVVADAVETLARFAEWSPLLAAAGVPVAFVGQDGQERLPVPWGDFRCWFIGGSTAWKLSEASADLAAEARRRGKWLHMGRVNSHRRIRAAISFGCDSIDGGQFSRWGDVKLERGCEWVKAELWRAKHQGVLW